MNIRALTRRLFKVAAAVAVIAALGVGSTGCGATGLKQASGASSDTGYISGQAVTSVPPEERTPAAVATGPALDGDTTVSTGDYPGKIVVINVWGSWCAPCRQEAPDLVEAATETASIAQFIGINIRDPDPAPAQAFVRAFKVTYPSIYDPNARELVKFNGQLAPNAIPSTLIIDRQGRVAVRIVGVISKTTLVTIINEVDQGR